MYACAVCNSVHEIRNRFVSGISAHTFLTCKQVAWRAFWLNEDFLVPVLSYKHVGHGGVYDDMIHIVLEMSQLCLLWSIGVAAYGRNSFWEHA